MKGECVGAKIAFVTAVLVAIAPYAGCAGTPAPRQVIGVSMAHFDDNWLTILRVAMRDHAATFPGFSITFVDAQGDVTRQLSQVQSFVAETAAAIIVNAADTASTPALTKIARDAGVPLVYVNRRPAEETLPANVVFVGSDDRQAGELQMEELARLMNHRGNVAIMVGELASNGAQMRTSAVETVVARYSGMRVLEKQVANFQRERGLDLMNNWLTAGARIDAVAANNDEMAIGAIMALQQAGTPPGRVLVGGIDATPDALAALENGTLAVSVFQDARAQGRGAVEAAVKLSRGEPVDSFVWIPFELVTRENYKSFLRR